ncbi:hypothetical protein METBIDRAFT_80055 [Metschnikowia bicuspidata var. bicuspidata NRRL YB-4993]|uniref:Exocyst complex component Sec8 n=1 Tax=Metschnikowia bicuspidata var. bicuspidata NRRL YB-4993 TaxID=869754 RepID=A0A1A0H5D2_9ASCO|nr:hypothetical protein METBIDRAFT_80055 [Metschnikowia bicuspidata var. bicuspidata NRRL YB-4993]OBA19117.1 hypothetical protein METBIDRAFT_80055 [Metschnikowia bicuspidata var. bicuspidata NRRL YB-4993]
MSNRHRATSMAFSGNVSDDEMKKSLQSLADLKSVYKDIHYDWPQLIQGEVTPIELAISLLDDTSVGLAHRKSEFDELCETTGQALKAAVVENHETFNNSIGLYHQLISIAKDSQLDSKVIKDLIETSTKDMRDRSASLKVLDQSSTKYSEMIEILDAMEYLRDIPAQIDQLITEKKIYEVYDVIADGYKTASRYNLWSLSSMNATQNYLEVQSNNLYDMIIDELQNEIYLKSTLSSKESWSNMIHSNNPEITSFMTLVNSLTTLELYIYNLANLDINEISASLTENTKKFLESQLPQLHQHYRKGKTSKPNYALLLESKLNPSTASYFYIYRLLSTASKLNKLQSVTQILLNSLHLELQYMTNKITEECKLLNIHKLARLEKAKVLEHTNSQDIISGHGLYDSSVHILQEYFGSFFLRCLIVLLKHKIACEIVKMIRSTDEISSYLRKGLNVESAHLYDFHTTWTIMSKEINDLIEIYIHGERTDLSPSRPDLVPSQVNQVLTKKQLFRLEDATGSNSNESSKELKAVLDEMFPGFLISSRKSHVAQRTENSPYITTERLSSSVDALVPRNIFNMRIILEYFLVFISGANNLFLDFEITKSISTPPFQFYQNVMHKSFLARIKEQLNLAFDGCMTNDMGVELRKSHNKKTLCFNQEIISLSEADFDFDESDKSKPSRNLRVYLNAVQFEQILSSACFTLNTSFSYRKEFSDLILEILKKFSGFYNDYYRELLATGGSHDITEINLGINEERTQQLRLNKWMNAIVLTNLTETLIKEQDKQDEKSSKVSKECDLMFYETVSGPRALEVSKDDLLDDDSFHHVCVLLKTSSWVLTWLPSMKKVSNLSSTDEGELEINKLRQKFIILENGRAPTSAMKKPYHVYLTLDLNSMNVFNDVIKTFETIRKNALIALRYDLRLKTMHHISQSFEENFILTTEPADSDAFISLLNREVYYIGAKIGEVLNTQERNFILTGLSEHISRAFVKGSELVSVINQNGIKRIILNIFTTQQMLRSVVCKEDKVDLSDSSRYFEMFTLSEHNLLQKISQETLPFTKGEILNLLRLMYSEKLTSANVTSFNKTRYSELVKKVSDLLT